jgi:hypothetical protein
MDDNVVKLRQSTTIELAFDEDYLEDDCPYRMRIVTADHERGIFLGRDEVYSTIAALIDLLKQGEEYDE